MTAGSIGKLQHVGPPLNETGRYTLTVAGGKLVDCRHEDVEPACRTSWDHALDHGWVTLDQWFEGVLTLD